MKLKLSYRKAAGLITIWNDDSYVGPSVHLWVMDPENRYWGYHRESEDPPHGQGDPDFYHLQSFGLGPFALICWGYV